MIAWRGSLGPSGSVSRRSPRRSRTTWRATAGTWSCRSAPSPRRRATSRRPFTIRGARTTSSSSTTTAGISAAGTWYCSKTIRTRIREEREEKPMSRELLERIDWAYFPKPYDEELPHYAAVAYERLTPEGVELLDEVIAVHASNPGFPVVGDRPPRPQWQEQGEDRMLERLEALPEWDRDAIVALTQHFKRASEASIDRAQGEIDLMQQMLALHAKAAA